MKKVIYLLSCLFLSFTLLCTNPNVIKGKDDIKQLKITLSDKESKQPEKANKNSENEQTILIVTFLTVSGLCLGIYLFKDYIRKEK